MEEKIRVHILCCNRLLRESVARLLAKRAEFGVVAPDSVSVDSPTGIEPFGADVLVADSLRPLVEAWPCFHSKKTERVPLKCVLIAMQDEPKQFLTAVKHGALGYVLQDASAEDIVAAIRIVAQGEAICPPALTRMLFDYVASRATDLPNNRTRAQTGLTRREQQLVPLIGQGLTNKEIAAKLGISEQTVKNHIHRILRKVGVDGRMSVFDACQEQSMLRKDSGSNAPAPLSQQE
jgi:DNA-binding NarL/FixJ family response regulator